ncbi:unnamed protein product [Schistosoma margrebowiei]|uniref:CCHC-type domain-containing protein n=1 Tax=Schistosoma margrebowiei TaxID=48269 RepID=A0A3P7ZV77_9TREM|nr:unnamed protein product [Schistosoma margrebowiei]
MSCVKFHAFNSCKFRNFKCIKCGDVGHIQSVCNTNVHLTATNINCCNSDSTKSSIHNGHLSLPTILKDSIESHSRSVLNETQNPCETTVSNQSIYQTSHVIVPGMAFPNDSHNSDEIPCKSEENMLDEHNYDQKPDEIISAKSNLDVISNIIRPHIAFVPCEKLVQCESRVLNELDSDYNSDDFISTAVHPYHKSTLISVRNIF